MAMASHVARNGGGRKGRVIEASHVAYLSNGGVRKSRVIEASHVAYLSNGGHVRNEQGD